MSQDSFVELIEVGPRDGLQNESVFVPTADKIAFINALSETGLKRIEATSFVSSKVIPQLADHDEVYEQITKHPDIRYMALVPNQHGMHKALDIGVQEIAVFTAASELFNQHNINCSIEESLARFAPVITEAHQHRIPVRAYISCVLGCPYEGHIEPKQVMHVLERLLAMGINEISLGDTIGVGTAKQTRALIKACFNIMDRHQLAMHFHDTYGQAVANIYASLEQGIRKFDSAVAGLGGCPYARGSSGNVATEDVLYLLHGLGMETGVDIFKIVSIGDSLCQKLQKPNPSKVARALLSKGY